MASRCGEDETQFLENSPPPDDSQVLEFSDCVGNAVNWMADNWAETEIADGCQDTAVVDDDEERLERTVVMDSEEDESDDVVSPCEFGVRGVEGKNGAEEMGSQKRQTSSIPCSRDMGKMDFAAEEFDIGLSYVRSQEPSALSQANAIDSVEKLLSDHNVGSSQEINPEKSQDAKPLCLLSAKGAQCLASRAARGCSGRTGIFDWVDTHEDERGGDFFGNKDVCFRQDQGSAQKLPSLPPKLEHPNVFCGAYMRGNKESGHNRIFSNIPTLTSPESNLILDEFLTGEKLYASKTKAKTISKDIYEHADSKSMEHRLEETEVVGCIEDMYEVGPSTQMAAEAMQVLFHGPTVVHGARDDAHLPGEISDMGLIGGITLDKASSADLLLQHMVSSTPGSVGKAVSPRKRKALSTRHSSRSRRRTGNPRVERKKTEGTSEKKTNARDKKNVSAKEFPKTTDRGKVRKTEARSFVKKVDKCCSLLASDGQLSVSSDLIIPETQDRYIAMGFPRQTRQLNYANSPNGTESSSATFIKGMNGLPRVRPDAHYADASGLLKLMGKGSSRGSNKINRLETNVATHCEVAEKESKDEELLTSVRRRDTFRPTKRRKTHQIIGSSNGNGILNNSFLSVGVKPVTSMQPTRQKRIKSAPKSLPEILDTVKRKKRTVKSFSHGPTSEIGSKENLTKPVFFKGGPRSANNCSSDINHRESLKEVIPKQEARFECLLKDVQENSPGDEVQPSGLACTMPLEDIRSGFPSCMTHNPLKISRNKGFLNSLVIANSSSSVLLKDMRRRKEMANVRVLFSQHLDQRIIKQQRKILKRLGVPIASSISEATHFIADNFARTRNMLEAIATGKPVVTHLWLESCGQASCFINEKNYILRDFRKEKEIGFSMPISLNRASQCPLLLGRSVFITPNVKPDHELIASLVKAAHGRLLAITERIETEGKNVPDDLIIISCEEDYGICRPLLKKGAQVFSSELLLNGIVIQKLEFKRHRLLLH